MAPPDGALAVTRYATGGGREFRVGMVTGGWAPESYVAVTVNVGPDGSRAHIDRQPVRAAGDRPRRGKGEEDGGGAICLDFETPVAVSTACWLSAGRVSAATTNRT